MNQLVFTLYDLAGFYLGLWDMVLDRLCALARCFGKEPSVITIAAVVLAQRSPKRCNAIVVNQLQAAVVQPAIPTVPRHQIRHLIALQHTGVK